MTHSPFTSNLPAMTTTTIQLHPLLSVQATVPESVEEYDALAGAGTCLARAIQLDAQAWTLKQRKALAEAVAALPTTQAPAKGQSDLKYITAELEAGRAPANTMANLAQQVADARPLLPGNYRKPSAEFIALAEAVVEGVEAGRKSREQVIATLEQTPGIKVGSWSVENLARAIAQREEFRARQAATDLV